MDSVSSLYSLRNTERFSILLLNVSLSFFSLLSKRLLIDYKLLNWLNFLCCFCVFFFKSLVWVIFQAKKLFFLFVSTILHCFFYFLPSFMSVRNSICFFHVKRTKIMCARREDVCASTQQQQKNGGKNTKWTQYKKKIRWLWNWHSINFLSCRCLACKIHTNSCSRSVQEETMQYIILVYILLKIRYERMKILHC